MSPITSASAGVVCLLVLLAYGGSPVQASGSRSLLQTSEKNTLSGTAILLATDYRDRSERSLIVTNADGQRVKVLPADPAVVRRLRTGQPIKATGEFTNNGNGRGPFKADTLTIGSAPANINEPILTPDLNEDLSRHTEEWEREIQAVDGTAQGGQRRRLLQAGTTWQSINPKITSLMTTLFIPIVFRQPNGTSCPGTSPNPISPATLKTYTFQESAPDDVTVGGMFNGCSYNKTMLTNDTSMVTTLVVLPCSGTTNGVTWSAASCDFADIDSWSNAADIILTNRGINLADYAYRVYYLPPNACGFVGMGYLGCDGTFNCRSWVGGNFWTQPMTTFHELGHNLYLGHASSLDNAGNYDEYGDNSGAMGYCCESRCHNTPHAWQLGWARVTQLNGTSLPIGYTFNTSVPAASLSAPNGLRIVPTWAPSADPVFIGYRVKARGDMHISSYLDKRVFIYASPIGHTYDPQHSYLRGTLMQGEAYLNPSTNLIIRRGYTTLNAWAIITVCRRGGPGETATSCANNIDWNCNGLAGAADPLCAAYS